MNINSTTDTSPRRTDQDFIQSASVTSMMRALLIDEKDELKNPDYLARHFVSEPWSAFLDNPQTSLQQMEKRLPGGVYYLLVRTRYFDSSMVEWIKQHPKSQIVSLGSGFDTRSIRFNTQPNELTFFDVDLKAMLDYKKNIILRESLSNNNNIHYVSTNFQTDNLFEKLSMKGFDNTLPTYFVCEGVSFFLEQHIFEDLLSGISSLQSNDVIFAFDYAFRDYIEGDLNFYGAKETHEELKYIAEPHVFGLNYDEVSSFFRVRGFRAMNNYTASMLDLLYLGDKYGQQSDIRSTAFFGLTELEMS